MKHFLIDAILFAKLFHALLRLLRHKEAQEILFYLMYHLEPHLDQVFHVPRGVFHVVFVEGPELEIECSFIEFLMKRLL